MLKFYSFIIPSTIRVSHSGAHGRYYLVSDGKRFAAYNESTYSTIVFGDQAHDIPVGDDEYTDLCHAVQRIVYVYLSRRISINATAHRIATQAEEVVQSLVLMPETEMVRHDSHAYKRALEQLLSRFTAKITNMASYSMRYRWDSRMEKFIDARVDRIKHLSGYRPRLTAQYKGIGFNAEVYAVIKRHRQHLAEYVSHGVQHDDWNSEIQYHLSRLHSYSSSFVDSEFLSRLSDLSNGQASYEHCDCGHIEETGETHEVRNDTWCHSCFQDEAVHVEDRDEYWPRDDAYYHESDDLYYSYEEEYDNDDDDDNDDEPSNLLSYSTNVLRHVEPDASITSSPFGNFTMGVELEMCSGRNMSMREAIDDVRSELGESYCVCKSDGSLPGDGFEVVTAPRGLDEHIRRFKAWDVNSSYRAWNAGTCGLHVHVDSRAFTPMTLGKFLMFINDDNNADFIRSLAGRHPKTDSQARHYCAADDQSLLTNPKTAVKGKDSSRYRMVNVCNMDRSEMNRLGIDHYKFDTSGRKFNTVELRIFRASLKKERLLAQIEFTHAAVMFVRSASYRDLTHGAFKGWLARSYALYPHLAAWYEVAPKKKANPNAVALATMDETNA